MPLPYRSVTSRYGPTKSHRLIATCAPMPILTLPDPLAAGLNSGPVDRPDLSSNVDQLWPSLYLIPVLVSAIVRVALTDRLRLTEPLR